MLRGERRIEKMTVSRREVLTLFGAGLVAPRLRLTAEDLAYESLIWRKPLPANELVRFGASGEDVQPRAPFEFLEEDMGGSNPKVRVRDASGREWIAKWGEEVCAESFASRIAAAAGYFVRTAIFVPEGRIEGVRDLNRAKSDLDGDGSFKRAVFKLIANDQPYLAGNNWSWTNNPFLNTEDGRCRLNGLKVVMMLTSNWDNKTADDPAAGPNTAIYDERRGGRRRFLYAFDDWGATMGRWGGVIGRSKWDAKGFAEQTPELVEGLDADGMVQWGYEGKDASELKEGIRPVDVAELLTRFSGVRPGDWIFGLERCGAELTESELFARALQQRFHQLAQIADRA